MANRRLRSDTATASSNMAKNAAKAPVEPPEGVVLRSDEEKTLWAQFSTVRSREDWRDFDLYLLADLVGVECDIRHMKADLAIQGVVLENARGTMVANPLVGIIDNYRRQALAIMRSLSLHTQGDKRSTASRGNAERAHRERIKSEEGGVSLLAVR